MPKSDDSFNPAEYAPVASRITRFYERYATGRIVTELVSRTEREDGVFEVIFRALVYRTEGDTQAAATGYAFRLESQAASTATPSLMMTPSTHLIQVGNGSSGTS